MVAVCPHGLPPDQCLICPTLPQLAPTASPARARRVGSRLQVGGVVASIVAIGVVAWLVAGIVFAALHVLELIAVAAVAGWVGYRVGRFRGERHRS